MEDQESQFPEYVQTPGRERQEPFSQLQVSYASSDMPERESEAGISKVFDVGSQATAEPVALFSPAGPQILGENSSIAEGFLPDGLFPILENLIPDDLSAQVRKGSASVYAGASVATSGATYYTLTGILATYTTGNFSAPVYRGHCHDARTGILYVAIGYTESGSDYTDVIWYSPTNGGWTYKTKSNGSATNYYGNTRFSGKSEMIQFAIVEEKHWFDTDAFAGDREYGYIVAIYPDGKQWPRVAPSVDNDNTYEFAIHRPLDPPELAACWYQARFARWIGIDNGVTARTNTGTKLAATINTTDDYISVAMDTGAVLADDYFTLDIGGVTTPATAQSGATQAFNPWGTYTGAGVAVTHLLMKYFVLSIGGENLPIGFDLWRNLRIQISNDSSTWITIYDGAYINKADGSGYSYPAPIKVPYQDGSGRYLIAFAFPKDRVTSQTYRYIRFTQSASGEAPASAASFNIELIALASGLPGRTQFGVTYFHSQSRAESPMVPCRWGESCTLQEMGGRKGSIRIPEDEAMFYNYRIYTPQIDGTNYPTGTEYVLTYARPKGGFWGLLSGDHQRAQVYTGGAWSYATGNNANDMPDLDISTAGGQRIRHVTVEFVVPRTPPSGLNVGIPPGVALATANQRLFVGGARMFRSSATYAAPLSDTSNGGYSIAISKARCPFHFDSLVQFLPDGSINPDSPTAAQISGDKVTALHTFSAGDIGGDSVIAFSSSGTYIIAGLDAYQLSRPTKIGDVGCVAPYSVASNSRTVFWLDDQGQVRAYGEESGVPSRDVIDDQLKAIPSSYRKYATGAVYSDMYILGFTESGQTTNTRALVYDTIRRRWFGWRSSKYKYAGLYSIFDSGERKLLCFDTALAGIYQLETSDTTDAATSITAKIKSREIHAGYYNRVKGEDVTLLVTGHASNQLTLTWTSLGVSTPVTDTIGRTVDSGSTLAWINSRKGTGQVPGYTIMVDGTMVSGERIYAFYVQNSIHPALPRSSEA